MFHETAVYPKAVGGSVSILIITVLLVVVAAVLLYPFVASPRKSSFETETAHDLAQRLRHSRDLVYEEIRTLQQERHLGNLAESEYLAQFQTARIRAAELLRQQQEVQQTIRTIQGEIDGRIRAVAAEESDGNTPT